MLRNRSIMMRSLSVVIFVIIMLASVLTCTESVNAAAKLRVTASSKTIYTGQTAKLKANSNVKWSISKKGIAKLTKSGKRTARVKALKTGTFYVTAKTGNQTKKVKMTVKSPSSKLRLTATADVIGLGEVCTVFVHSGKTIVDSIDYIFTTSDKTVASVDNRGHVTGLTEGTVRITAKSKTDKQLKASIKITVVDAKAGVVSVSIDMSDASRYPAGKAVKAWFPVPVSDYNQTISHVIHNEQSLLPDDKAMISTDPTTGMQTYYVEWDSDVAPADRKAKLSFHVYRREVVHGKDLRSKEKGTVDTVKFARYLKETTYSGSLTDGIVKETADKIVADAKAKTVYDKAHAIYLWICENITRDKSLPNRELGDVVAVLSGERNAGSCIDINSIFVALCNAEGIPARDSFGLKLQKENAGQNCRAEFYLPGYGWVEVDPAMPLGKIMYKESEYRGENAPKAEEWESIKDTYWTYGSAEWICQTHDRDIILDPAQSAAPDYMVNPDGTLNHFMFPYGEYDGKYIKGWGDFSKTFSYEYSFEEEDPTDCGC